MRYIFLVLALYLTASCNAQTNKGIENLKNEFQKIIKPYFFEAPNFTGWVEGSTILLIGEKQNALENKFLFIALKDTTLIGIYNVAEPVSFNFDTEGNSTLSRSSDFFMLPLWVVKNKTKILAKDKKIIFLLDNLYEKTMQANDNELDEKTLKEYQSYQIDTSLANRHIALLFDSYQTIITETASKGKQAPSKICIPLMQSLSVECLKLYNRIPALVYIYMGEALQSAGMVEDARKHFKMSLQFYPTSIPLQVYNYELELDQIEKKKQLLNLKNKYRKHWMVKEL
ncbi:hypothetical protein [Ferruginibacter sp.]